MQVTAPSVRFRKLQIGWLLLASLTALLAIAVGADLWRSWMNDSSLSFAPIMPILSLFLLWREKDGLRNWDKASTPGLIMMCLSAPLYVCAVWADIEALKPLMLIGILAGGVQYLGGYRNLKAVVLANIGEYQESLEIYADVLAKHPDQSKIWMSYGHALSSAGRLQESIAAYRRCIQLAPSFGEAHYSLANLKTFRFTDSEMQIMRGHLANPETSPESRAHFHFAIGKALEDAESFAESFEHYDQGNQLRLARVRYEAADTTALVRRSKASKRA